MRTPINKTTHRLDQDYLVMDVCQYDNGDWRAEVIFQLSSKQRTQIMVQERSSQELVIAAIARDFSTFAARALATLPTIGLLVDVDIDDADDDDAKETA
jgi:hypothetical protein